MASDLFVSKFNKQEEEEKGRERERDEIISRLPKIKGWVNHYMYQYQGFWYREMVVKGIMNVQEHFKARSTDIVLATNPKCGSTWLRALAFEILNRTTTNFPKSFETVPTLEIKAFRDKVLWAEIENEPSPRLLVTHIPYTSLPESILNSGCLVVYINRNPQDMLVSYWHFLGKFKDKEIPIISLDEAFDSFCRGESSFGPYWDHVLGYYKASVKWPERFLFMEYEGMHGDTYNHVKRLADFMGYTFSVEEEANGVIQDIIQQCSFETMSNLVANKKQLHKESVVSNDAFFRKGQIGYSKNYLTPQMMERLDRIIQDKFQGSGLSPFKLQ